MKSQGMDGISIGEMREGVSVGEYMLKFCPLVQDALQQSTHLKSWILENFGEKVKFPTIHAYHYHPQAYDDTVVEAIT